MSLVMLRSMPGVPEGELGSAAGVVEVSEGDAGRGDQGSVVEVVAGLEELRRAF